MPQSIDQEIRTLQSIFWSERDPDGLAFAPLADAFRRNGQVREALDLLTDGMSRHPDYATGHVVATRLYVDQGMDSEAELAARRVLTLDPENLVAHSALVSILTRKGEAGEAARHKTALFAADPESDEARAVADVGPEAGGVDEAAGGEPGAGDGAGMAEDAGVAEEGGELEVPGLGEAETPLQAVAGEAGPEAPEITELVPETMYHDEDESDFLGGLSLEPELAEDTEGSEEELSDAMATLGLSTDEDEEPDVDSGTDALPGLERELEDLDMLGDAEAVEEEGQAGELAADPLDLTTLSVDAGDEAAVDLADLAPDEPEEAVVDLADLAPDEPEEAAVDLADLAPDEPGEAAMDLADLAPDEPEEAAMDVADLAPDEPEDAALDVAALAPDAADEGVMDLDDLAPDEPDAVDLAALAPDEPGAVVDLAALAPEASVEELAEEMDIAEESDGGDDVSTEPVYTRTLADLYIKQGFPEKALEVLKHIQRRQPEAPDLEERIAALEEGDVPEGGFGEAAKRAAQGGPGSSSEVDVPEARVPDDESPSPADAPPPPTAASVPEDPAGASEDEVERRARELADPGDQDDHGMDTPFAWAEAGEEAADDGDEPIASYLETLLDWENRAES